MASKSKTSSSKRRISLKEGGGNPEVMFVFKISPNLVETLESFKVQLFNTNSHFSGLIQNQMYTGSSIHKEGNNEIKFNNNSVMYYNTPPLRISPGVVQGQLAMGAGAVFLTAESSIIISSPRSNAEDSKKLAMKHEAIGRIVNDHSSIDGTAMQHILCALECSPPKSLSIVNCYLVT